MGTWGTAIFSDDLACDIKDRYRQLLGDGLEGPQATQVLFTEYQEVLEDDDSAPVFWLALADTQWRYGRLEPDIKDRAIMIIDDGSDMHRWVEDPRLFEKRQVVLTELREKLFSQQPPPRRIPQQFRESCDWEIGEIIAYRLLSGNLALFRVIGHYTDLGGTAPIIEILDWVGKELPKQDELTSAGILANTKGETQLKVMSLNRRELPRKRVIRTGIKLEPAQAVMYPLPVSLWRWLDGILKTTFGM